MTKRVFRILLCLAALSLIAYLIIYSFLPALVPMRWDANGQITLWQQKSVTLPLALLPLGSVLLFRFLPLFDPRRRNYQKHQKSYDTFCIAVVLMFIGFIWLTLSAALGAPVSVSSGILLLIGILFVVFGNYMPQIRSNFFFGIKTPWTLSNEEVWRKTHRLGGTLFVIGGLFFCLAALILALRSLWLASAVALIISIVPVVYSFMIFRKYSKPN